MLTHGRTHGCRLDSGELKAAFYYSHKMSAIRTDLMRAVRVTQFGGPDVLKVETNVPIPEPADDQVSVASFPSVSQRL